MAKRIVIIGATSTICRSVAGELAGPGDRVCLAARDQVELSRIAADLSIRRSPELVIQRRFDAGATEEHQAMVEDIAHALGGIDIVIVGTGELGDQMVARSSIPAIKEIIDSNYAGVATVLAPIADLMVKQGAGHIAVLSSVAGDRGMQSNYVYGSAKSGMSTYLEGLENRLHRHGIRVSTIKLGFVDTKMVFGKSGMFLVASPAAVAKTIVSTLRAGTGIIYVPWFWRYIMLVIVHLPAFIFKRMNL